MNPDDMIAHLIEIYLYHLKKGSIYAAQGVRKEMLIWKSLSEYKAVFELDVQPPKSAITPMEDASIEAFMEKEKQEDPEKEQEILDETLKDTEADQTYCYYFKHKDLMGFNPLFYTYKMLEYEGHHFCSRTCKEGFIRDRKNLEKPKRDWSLNGRWSLKHEACINCGTTKKAHFGKGLCSQCYPNRKEIREKMEQVESVEFSLQEEPPKKWKKYADVLPCSNVDCEVDGMHPKSGMLEISGLYFCQQACADQHFTS